MSNFLKKELPLILVSLLTGSLITTIVFNNINENKNANRTIIEKNSLANSVEKVYDAVVAIQQKTENNSVSTGSGFIYKTDNKYAYILTNEHVVSLETETKVIFTNDNEVEAEILGKDAYLDLAVLKVNKKNVSKTAIIGNSEEIRIGDTIFIIGSPIGYEYRGSVSAGVLSGVDRLVKTKTNDKDWIMKVFQIDASVNPGNSGGPVLNINGEVIGICSLKLTDNEIEGMGFAIPIEYAMSKIDLLEKGEKITWPKLGISMIDVSDTSAIAINNIDVPKEVTEGVIVADIKNNDLKGKIKKGDIIISINDNNVRNSAFLRYELYKNKPGDKIKITILRNNHKKDIEVKLNSE